jgi:chorismate dehydratase
LKLGAVSYLNAEPLIWPLESGEIDHPHTIARALPGEVAGMLAGEEVHCALAPVTVMLDHPGFVSLPDVAISCRGPVASVLLFHDDPLGDLETIWLDPASRTSNLLVQILRHRASDKACRYIISTEDEAPPVVNLPERTGRLVIGDPALSYASESSPASGATDLGQLWKEQTNHPFTFARWIARNGDIGRTISPLVRQARDWSLRHLHELIEPLARKYDFRSSLVDRYLRQNITYMFGPREEAGEREFFVLAREIRRLQDSSADA